MKRKYEIMYIIRPNVDLEDIKNINNKFVDVFKNHESEVVQSKDMGLKNLAYEIDHLKKGHYVWFLVDATTEAIAEFNRLVRINEQIIRYLVVKKEEV